mmetsp:Transcript_13382/g.42166  ORF Transcript_13382/g.42166 Transcript_13382/m.42166 type:complete len:213 (+) Transcript_13382:1131-1769(+)
MVGGRAGDRAGCGRVVPGGGDVEDVVCVVAGRRLAPHVDANVVGGQGWVSHKDTLRVGKAKRRQRKHRHGVHVLRGGSGERPDRPTVHLDTTTVGKRRSDRTRDCVTTRTTSLRTWHNLQRAGMLFHRHADTRHLATASHRAHVSDAPRCTRRYPKQQSTTTTALLDRVNKGSKLGNVTEGGRTSHEEGTGSRGRGGSACHEGGCQRAVDGG